MANDIDIVVWLREQRNKAAGKRDELFAETGERHDKIKSGAMAVEEANHLNERDTVEANVQDKISAQLFTALTEIERSRKIIQEMTKALRDRGHYCPDEPPGR